MAANATALRLLLEHLVDELDELERIVWAEPDPEREDLRRRLSESMMYATSALDLAEAELANALAS